MSVLPLTWFSYHMTNFDTKAMIKLLLKKIIFPKNWFPMIWHHYMKTMSSVRRYCSTLYFAPLYRTIYIVINKILYKLTYKLYCHNTSYGVTYPLAYLMIMYSMLKISSTRSCMFLDPLHLFRYCTQKKAFDLQHHFLTCKISVLNFDSIKSK